MCFGPTILTIPNNFLQERAKSSQGLTEFTIIIDCIKFKKKIQLEMRIYKKLDE